MGLVQTFTNLINSYCGPAQLYILFSGFGILVISLISIVALIAAIGMEYISANIAISILAAISVLVIIVTTLAMGWSWILNQICKLGYTKISWALLFLPYVMRLLMFAMEYGSVNKKKKIKNM